MKYISKVTLKNFQCHKNLTATFSENVTSIIGDNNGGKSSIIRALYWILTNSPRGNWMQREKNGKLYAAEAYIEFDDGVVVGRIKGNNINKYIMDNDVWEKFGNNVPDPIMSYFNNLYVDVGKKILPNIHMQDDDPFMVSDSSTSRGLLVNYLTGINVGDQIRKDFTRQIKDFSKKILYNEGSIEENSLEIDELKEIVSLEDKVNIGTKNINALTNIKQSILNIQKYQTSKESISIHLKKLQSFPFDKINGLSDAANNFKQACHAFKQVQDIHKAAYDASKRILHSKTQLRKLKPLENVKTYLENISKIKIKIDSLEDNLKTINMYKETINKIKVDLKFTNKHIKSFDGSICDYCGSKIRI